VCIVSNDEQYQKVYWKLRGGGVLRALSPVFATSLIAAAASTVASIGCIGL
jgi:hypothetical protein